MYNKKCKTFLVIKYKYNFLYDILNLQKYHLFNKRPNFHKYIRYGNKKKNKIIWKSK